jgi:D-apiose dehydrogenase
VKSYKVAIIGCGNVARLHAGAYRRHADRVEVVAACDPLADQASQLSAQFPGCRPYTTVEDAVRHRDWEIGIVCSPTPVHLQVVVQLAGHGKHAFVEKPMADNLADARRMLESCVSAGVQLSVHQNFRYHYPFDLARRLIRAGRIGRVLTVAHRDLVFRQDEGWRNSAARHSLAVMGIHWLDGFRWMLDDEPEGVVCQLASSPLINARGDTDAVIQATFANGAAVSYVQSFSSPGPALETNVIGDQGSLRLTHTELHEWRVQTDESTEVVHPNPSGSDKALATFLTLDQFLQALDANIEASNSGRDNLRTVAFLEAAYRSAELRRVVRPEPDTSELVP